VKFYTEKQLKRMSVKKLWKHYLSFIDKGCGYTKAVEEIIKQKEKEENDTT